MGAASAARPWSARWASGCWGLWGLCLVQSMPWRENLKKLRRGERWCFYLHVCSRVLRTLAVPAQPVLSHQRFLWPSSEALTAFWCCWSTAVLCMYCYCLSSVHGSVVLTYFAVSKHRSHCFPSLLYNLFSCGVLAPSASRGRAAQQLDASAVPLGQAQSF